MHDVNTTAHPHADSHSRSKEGGIRWHVVKIDTKNVLENQPEGLLCAEN